MTAPNQRHGVPRYSDSTPLAMRRGHFLDRTQKCYWGPDQDPNAAPGFGIRMRDDVEWPFQPASTFGHEIVREYSPPRDWPGAGSLLYVPQVVWLAFAFRFGVQPPIPVTFSSGLTVSYSETWVHPHVAERVRLKAAYDSAKATIEALRPNRTYVKTFDWFDQDDTGTFSYEVPDSWQHLSAPPVDEAAYFGTDFLHVFAGDIFEIRKIDVNDYVRLDSDLVNFTFLPGNTSHIASVARVVAALTHFRNYGVKLYLCDISSYVPLPPYTSDVDPQGVIDAHNIDINSFNTTVTAGNTRSHTAGTASIGILNTATSPAVAGELPGLTTALTADALVRLIADHFGFDPDTGLDL